MSEKQRTAAEIWAYCNQLGRILSDVPSGVSDLRAYRMGVYVGFVEHARADLPRLLEAADESWGMVARLYHEGATADLPPDTVAEVERIIDEYGWLEAGR